MFPQNTGWNTKLPDYWVLQQMCIHPRPPPITLHPRPPPITLHAYNYYYTMDTLTDTFDTHPHFTHIHTSHISTLHTHPHFTHIHTSYTSTLHTYPHFTHITLHTYPHFTHIHTSHISILHTYSHIITCNAMAYMYTSLCKQTPILQGHSEMKK